MAKNYIKSIREKVNHLPIILVFSGGILVNNKNEILLQKRSDFNEWGLPGGAIEFGESSIETCKREFKEETGLDVNIIGLLGVSSKFIQHYPNGDVAQSVLINYLIKKNSGNLIRSNHETLSLKYFEFNNLPKIFNKQHLNAINKYYNHDYPYYD
ncbi:NUDIX domain-containing protein [Apilactobacillus timberlakei]|uniref:NUDIX hydrolase n=1 Tax=Apilactobacillus timberlakei TaxID=2008380 RepID=UPI00112A562B|nr:NUDIX hydrolase [Apilactobacillus timberlakei]TPR23154.1 NUDIX domain-containing protein [Apilactobacillus timberlakei]